MTSPLTSALKSGQKIPILDLTPEIDDLWDDLNGAIQRVLRSTQFISGPDVKLFEDEVAHYLGVKHAVAMNSGTDALVIGLRALGIGPGDEVIVPAFTFFATAECVSILGATPVIVDVNESDFNIDPKQIELKITKKTKAIIPVHLFGHAAPMDEILAIAAKNGLKVVEDVAQAFSGEYRGKKLGSMGHVGTYSFFPSKNLGAYGDGGMLTTDDDQLADSARMLRFHGCRKKYHNEVAGYNSRLDTMQAAILRVKLPHVERYSDGRRRVAHLYRELLQGVPGITLPSEAAYTKHVFHQYTIKLQGVSRDQLHDQMAASGVDTMVYYPKALHELPLYKKDGLRMPISEKLTQEVLSLPIWPQMQEESQTRVVDVLKKSLATLRRP